MKSLWKTIAPATLALVLATGCGGTNNEAGEPQAVGGEQTGKLTIVTTFYPMYEFSRQVAGGLADVETLIPSGTEPHDWEPSPQDMAKMEKADIFVYNGLFEEWVPQALASTSSDNRIVVEAVAGLSLMEGVEDGHDHGHEEEHSHDEGHEEEHSHEEGHEDEIEEEHGLDPHVWLSPVLAQQQVQAIADGLKQADPDHADRYQANAEAYIAKLRALDEKFKSELAGSKRREFVTQHAAFGYLAKQYGLTQEPIAGLSPEQEPSPQEMSEIVEFVNEHEVKTIFFETLVDPGIAQTIADETGAATAVLNPLEGLTPEQESQGLDYLGIMEQNLAALKTALNE